MEKPYRRTTNRLIQAALECINTMKASEAAISNNAILTWNRAEAQLSMACEALGIDREQSIEDIAYQLLNDLS
jgi:hypothetical protein